MKNITLNKKLIFSFGLLSVLIVLIGMVGFIAITNIIGQMNEIADTRLPSIQNLLVISEAQTAIDSGENALLSKNLTAGLRNDIYKRFNEATKRYKNAWKIYEPLPQTKEEEAVWKQFVPAWEAWLKDHERYVELAKRYETAPTEENYRTMSDFGLLTIGVSFDKAEGLLNKLIEINEKTAREAVDSAHSAAFIARTLVMLVLLIALLISIGASVLVIRGIMKQLGGDPSIVLETANRVAAGDLTVIVQTKDGDTSSVLAAMKKMVNNLEHLVSNIITGSQNLAQAVEQISSGNQNLSQRTSEQASSLEEIASTVEQATATINQNAENAGQAKVLVDNNSRMAEEGNRISLEAVTAINEMAVSSKRVGEIIGVINEIAFQTNLLALNAAVEAARAGEQGRGFAVVAGEVRNLAQRSGNSAREIDDLISETIEKVERGTNLVNRTGMALKEVVDSAQKSSQIITEIAAASQEQKVGINQINTAIIEMDNMTQQNASLVEETASASEEMANQAQELLEMTNQFTISDVRKSVATREAR